MGADFASWLLQRKVRLEEAKKNVGLKKIQWGGSKGDKGTNWAK